MRAPRAIRFWAAGFELTQTAIRSRTPRFLRVSCLSRYVSRFRSTRVRYVAQREFTQRHQISLPEEIARARSTLSSG